MSDATEAKLHMLNGLLAIACLVWGCNQAPKDPVHCECDACERLESEIAAVKKSIPPACACGPLPASCKCEPTKSCECKPPGGGSCCDEPKGAATPPAPAAPKPPVRQCPPSCKVRR